jgi:hypothetical protein
METRMRPAPKPLLPVGVLAACALLAACSGGNKGGDTVQLKDMEVVDGTATDAMTDLDGVQSEGTATALLPGNTAENASTAPARPAEKAGNGDAEILSDQ